MHLLFGLQLNAKKHNVSIFFGKRSLEKVERFLLINDEQLWTHWITAISYMLFICNVHSLRSWQIHKKTNTSAQQYIHNVDHLRDKRAFRMLAVPGVVQQDVAECCRLVQCLGQTTHVPADDLAHLAPLHPVYHRQQCRNRSRATTRNSACVPSNEMQTRLARGPADMQQTESSLITWRQQTTLVPVRQSTAKYCDNCQSGPLWFGSEKWKMSHRVSTSQTRLLQMYLFRCSYILCSTSSSASEVKLHHVGHFNCLFLLIYFGRAKCINPVKD